MSNQKQSTTMATFVLSSSSFNRLSPAAQQEVIRVTQTPSPLTIPRFDGFDDLPPFDGAVTPPSSAAAAAPRRPAKRTDQPPHGFGSFGGWWKGPTAPLAVAATPAHPSPPKTPHQQRCELMKSILNNKGLPYTDGIIDNYYAWENDCNPLGNRFQKMSEFVRLYC